MSCFLFLIFNTSGFKCGKPHVTICSSLSKSRHRNPIDESMQAKGQLFWRTYHTCQHREKSFLTLKKRGKRVTESLDKIACLTKLQDKYINEHVYSVYRYVTCMYCCIINVIMFEDIFTCVQSVCWLHIVTYTPCIQAT